MCHIALNNVYIKCSLYIQQLIHKLLVVRIYNDFVRSDRSEQYIERKNVRLLFAVFQSAPDSFDEKKNICITIITNIKGDHLNENE